MNTITLSAQEVEALLRALQTSRVSLGEKRLVIIPPIENLKAMQIDSQRPFCNRNLMTDHRALNTKLNILKSDGE